MTLTNQPSLVEHKGMRFLIHDLPTNSNLYIYLKEFQKHHVTHLVRVCNSSYSKDLFEKNSIKVIDLPFDDGSSPPQKVIDAWLSIVDTVFPENSVETPKATIAVHCVAGLGRAPVLVAIAILERDNLSALDVITLIRKYRRGAINLKQMKFIEKYKKKKNNKKCKIQ